jgi:hypothetical protein
LNKKIIIQAEIQRIQTDHFLSPSSFGTAEFSEKNKDGGCLLQVATEGAGCGCSGLEK